MAEPYRLIPDAPGRMFPLVERVEDGALIPFEDGNRDYQIYLAWLEKGNAPDPAPQPIGDENATR